MTDVVDTTQWMPEVLPTKERFKKNDIEIINSARGGIEIRSKNFNDRLGWYRSNGFITPLQMSAGKKFYILWFFGGMKSKYAISKYNDMPNGNFETGQYEETQEQYILAKKAIRGVKEKKSAFNVCCIGDAAGRNSMNYLRSALDDLVKHFGYDKK